MKTNALWVDGDSEFYKDVQILNRKISLIITVCIHLLIPPTPELGPPLPSLLSFLSTLVLSLPWATCLPLGLPPVVELVLVPPYLLLTDPFSLTPALTGLTSKDPLLLVVLKISGGRVEKWTRRRLSGVALSPPLFRRLLWPWVFLRSLVWFEAAPVPLDPPFLVCPFPLSWSSPFKLYPSAIPFSTLWGMF